jgi:type I restriction enzyme S subunit
MSNWKNMLLGDAITFNPPETIAKKAIAKKIAMEKLTAFERKIKGYESATYTSSPKFRNGDTLLAKITPCLENGKTAQVDILEHNEVGFGSTEFIVLRGNANSINDFVFYLAKSPSFRKKAINCMEGTSGRKRVNESVLKLQTLRIPDINTQQKIAHVLSTLDNKIELNNKINAELEAMAKALYDYWFVQFDFPDKNGKPYKSSGGKMVWNDELKREIPVDWEMVLLSDLLNVVTGKKDANFATNNGIFPFFTCGEEVLLCDEFAFDGKAILVAGNGNFNVKLFNGKFNAYQRTYVLIPNDEKFYTVIFYALKKQLKKLTNSSAGSIIKFITKGDVENISLVLPKEMYNHSFLFNKLNLLTASIERNNQENQKLSELRDWLLPMLMNGQISIN